METSVIEVLALLSSGKRAEDFVLNQELESQRVLVISELLPKQIEPEGAKTFLEKLGLKFKEDIDDLFQKVDLPPGWKKVATKHPWLSMLVDQHGREIARIFFKSNYYDRVAALIVQPRYGVWEGESENVQHSPDQAISATVMDGGSVLGTGEILFMTLPKPSSIDRVERMRTWLQAKEEAYSWLEENFPEWHNPFAYWDCLLNCGASAWTR